MQIADHVDNLRRDGELMAEAAERAGPDAPVPPCPDWQVRDLVHHLGRVHRWAAAHVRDALVTPADPEAIIDAEGGLPPDADLVSWFRAGHDALVSALACAPADLECWTFLAAPSPVGFWARRQAHETAIHRVDAQAAAGQEVSGFPTDFAVDGVDELLVSFVARPKGAPRSESPSTLAVLPVDATRRWVVTLSGDPVAPSVSDDGGDAPAADCTVSGTASELYQWLWNRRDTDGLDVAGERSLVDLWRDGVRIRWRG